MMYDEDAIFELGEQIKERASDALKLVWEKTQDKDLFYELLRLIGGQHEDLVDKIYEEVGIEFCEECGGRIGVDCTCDDEGEPEEDEEALQEAEA